MMKRNGKGAERDASRHSDTRAGQSPIEEALCNTFDDYQCTGEIQVDFPKLCALLEFGSIPPVISKTLETEEEQPEENEPGPTNVWSKPHLYVEFKNKSPQSAKTVKITGWKVHENIFKVLNKMFPHLNTLETLYFWLAGLTDEMVMSLSNTMSLGCRLRNVYLDGNPLPNHSYHLLLTEDSVITRLFLRNNQIGDEGARLIGSALSTTKTSNKHLQFLNLAFNHIGDTGAAYLAQGLRLNRALLYLSLTNNQIGDSGAAQFSQVLGEFPLTHEEVMERRMLLLEKMGLNWWADTEQPDEDQDGRTSLGKSEAKINPKKKEVVKKEEKAAKKETVKKGTQKNPKAPEKAAPATGGKAAGKKKTPSADTPEEKSFTEPDQPKVEMVSPLLDPAVQCRDGQVVLPGNTTLMYLSLAGNHLTEKSLPAFLSSLEQQTDGGLLRLFLHRNNFPHDSELYLKINELLQLRNPSDKLETAAEQQEP